jgi:hypothetical protein
MKKTTYKWDTTGYQLLSPDGESLTFCGRYRDILGLDGKFSLIVSGRPFKGATLAKLSHRDRRTTNEGVWVATQVDGTKVETRIEFMWGKKYLGGKDNKRAYFKLIRGK